MVDTVIAATSTSKLMPPTITPNILLECEHSLATMLRDIMQLNQAVLVSTDAKAETLYDQFSRLDRVLTKCSVPFNWREIHPLTVIPALGGDRRLAYGLCLTFTIQSTLVFASIHQSLTDAVAKVPQLATLQAQMTQYLTQLDTYLRKVPLVSMHFAAKPAEKPKEAAFDFSLACCTLL